MGVRNRHSNNISIHRGMTAAGRMGNFLDRYEYREFPTAAGAEIWAEKQLGMEVQYDGLSADEANAISRVLFREFNDKPLAPVNLTGIYTVSRDKDPFDPFLLNGSALMGITPERINGVADEYHFVINIDTLEQLDRGEYAQCKTDGYLEQLQADRKRYETKWNEFSTLWVASPGKFKKGDYVANMEDYHRHLASVDSDIEFVRKLQEKGVHRWASGDYGDTRIEHLEMVVLHEIGHLRHIQLFPETSDPQKAIASRGLNDFMRGAVPFSLYSNWNKTAGENFAEHYALYRELPHVLKKKSPIGFASFDRQFRKI